ncbi:MAG: DUF1501 domain-containing protein [Pirellulaceae bacterium]|jgi:hypothetical protein|nr:DUF1501 domain-containing protein [Pirellulaceae bacterium]MDP6555502.1 DUF1501 domain-containing protein [Pirellulaceae bacterium]
MTQQPLATLEPDRRIDRRQFLGWTSLGLGTAALATLLNPPRVAGEDLPSSRVGLPGLPHVAPTAKHVIFLHQSGAPSQIDLFDPKPVVRRRHGEEMPASVRGGQRLTTMTSDQASKPLTASPFEFSRHGVAGTELSELLPHTAAVADDLCVVRSMTTEAINHDPAMTLFQTGTQQPGRPSMGSWTSYGLGSENENLPTYVVSVSGGDPGDQPLFDRLWSAGFIPSRHQGVRLRSGRDPVLFLSNPPGVSRHARREMLDGLAKLNRLQFEASGDPEINTRIAQFELAYRMQSSVPDLVDLSTEPKHTFDLYGAEARRPGSYAANCLQARRLVERGVRFVQLFHRGWDHHTRINKRLRTKCLETDQASAALVLDLKQRGLLKDTLIVWAGEFGRTVFCQGQLEGTGWGRDHHPRCFSIWLAGGGIRPGMTYGQTDDFSYNVTTGGTHVHDLQATILHCLGIDHTRLTYRHEGRDHRLTDVGGEVVRPILS